MGEECWICRRTKKEVEKSGNFRAMKQRHDELSNSPAFNDDEVMEPMTLVRYYIPINVGVPICAVCHGIINVERLADKYIHQNTFHKGQFPEE